MIGELNILQDSSIEEQERLARVKQLKRVCHYVFKNCKWEQVREFHGGFLACAEKQGGWSVDHTELTAEFLLCGAGEAQREVVYIPQQQQRQRGSNYNDNYGSYNSYSYNRRNITVGYNPNDEISQAEDDGNIYFCSRFNGKLCKH